MGTFLRQVTPVALGEKEGFRTAFASDDDLRLPVSIYLDSGEGSEEIIKSVAEVLRAYGFSNISRVYQAPGTFYIHFEAEFKTNDRKAAHQSSEELKAVLLSKKPPADAQKSQAVKVLHESFWRRVGRKVGTGILIGCIYWATTVVGGVVTDLIKDEVKAVVVEQAPKVDKFVAQELSPALAIRFHRVVTDVIRNSQHCQELPFPWKKAP